MSYLAFTVIKIERDALNAAEKRVHGSPAFNFQLSPQGSSYSTNRLSGTIMSLIIRPCMLTEDAPRAIGPNQRFVWLIGRPLEGLPGILSACGFPYLHWAVLINPPGLSRDRIIALFQTLRSPASVGRIAPQPIGQVHQLHFERNTGRTSRHVAGFTVLEFSQQFPRFSIAYVGLTTRTDQEINDLGSPSVAAQDIWLTRSWDYRVLKSNCQHYASYLLWIITGHEPFPRTISKLIESHVQPLNQYTKSIKGLSRATSSRSFGFGSSRRYDNWNPQSRIGLTIDSMHWNGFLITLEDSERSYLSSLPLGQPQALHRFEVTKNRDGSRADDVVGVLYSDVFLLFRVRNPDELAPWTTSSLQTSNFQDERLFLYSYLYPRHIVGIEGTRNGFRLNCQGCWLAREGSPSEWLTLEFQPSGSVLGDGTTWAWMHSFECFQQRLDVLELCTIFDRQPLEAAYVTEIDLHIEMKIYRAVCRMPLGSICYSGLRRLVRQRLEAWGHRPTRDQWSLNYKNCDGVLSPVTENFPCDTDGGWREFFAAVFFVDFWTEADAREV